jgi:leader peptidase (prepilin peptidase)/N-methyltransferase
MAEVLNLFSFLLGLSLGSFANVCIYRLPRKISIVTPDSFCPSCGKRIKWYHNIPLLSFILLRGRCAYCGEKISFLYPLVEGLTGIISFILFKKFGLSIQYLIYLLFCLSMIIVFFIDLYHYIIPNIITFSGIGAGILLFFLFPLLPRKDMLLGAITGGALFGGVSLLYYLLTKKVGLGEGDIKLIFMMGFFIGVKGVLFVTLLGSITGAIIGTLYLIFSKKGMREPIPFGPFLSFSAVLFVIVPEEFLAPIFRLSIF